MIGKKRQGFLVTVFLLIVALTCTFAACAEMSGDTDSTKLATLKAEVAQAFRSLPPAKSVVVDGDAGTVTFFVENETSEIDLSALRFTSVQIMVATQDGTPVTKLVLQEGENAFRLSATLDNITVLYTIRITRNAASVDPDPTHEHSYGTLIAESPATCIATGRAAYYECSVCHKLFDSEKKETTAEALVLPIDPDAHHWGDNGFCTLCGVEEYSVGLLFTLKADDTYEVSDIGTCTATNIVIPSVYKGKSVTSIGDKAFYECANMTSVKIGANVTSIEPYAFQSCTRLSGVTIPNSVTNIGQQAFCYCTGLTSLMISSSAKSIGWQAFCDCVGLTSLTIPASVTSIESSTFSGCTGLTSVAVEKGNGVYHSAGNCLIETENKALILGCKTSEIPEDGSVTKINAFAFLHCNGLTSIKIPDSVTEIEDSVFPHCTALTAVTLGANLECLGAYAFLDCSALTSITIPDSLRNIRQEAFEDCTALASIVIGNGVTTIGRSVFSGCTDLEVVYYKGTAQEKESISIGANNEELISATWYYYSETQPTAEGNFWHYVDGVPVIWEIVAPAYSEGLAYTLKEDDTYEVSGIGTCKDIDLVIPPTHQGKAVTSIKGYAFSNTAKSYRINSVKIPASVASIGEYAFVYRDELTSVEFAADSRLTSIGNYAFYVCTGLTTITIPSSVTSIEEVSFYRCYHIAEVYNRSKLNITKGGYDGGYVGYYAKAIYTSEFESKLSTDENGYVIYTDGAEKSLVHYVGDAKDLILPSGLTEINRYAFCDRDDLTSVRISDGVTSIGERALFNCAGLVSIVIPVSITSIESQAIDSCNGLTSVYYGGMDEQSVEKISIHRANSSLTSATWYYYSETQPKEGNKYWHYVDGVPTVWAACTHNYAAEVTSPTCTEGGYTTYTCAYCGDTYVADEKTALGHAYGNLVAEIPATCVATGTAAHYECSVCHTLFDANKVETTAEALVLPIDPDAHHWGEDGICTLCGAQRPSEGLAFVLKEDDTYEVVGIGTCTDLDIVIPATHQGKAVTSIGEDAFYYSSGFLSVTIPNSVTSIGRYAFCASSLASITIPNSVTSIGHLVFFGAGLTSIAIPASVTSLGGEGFGGCRSLAEIIVEEGNTVYCSVENCLIEKASGRLILGCKESVIPADGSVTSIGIYAFQDCIGLTSLVIPASVTRIDDWAFAGCGLTTVIFAEGSKLTRIGFCAFKYCRSLALINIPVSLSEICDRAFSECSNLTTVFYGGTSARANAISWVIDPISGPDPTPSPLTSATWYYYSETQPTVQGNFWHYVDGKIVIWDILHDYVPVVTEPTCTTGGYTTYTCTLCGDTYTANETKALGHTYGTLIAESPATCVATGTAAHYKCSVCHTLFDANKVETTAEALILPIDPKAHDLVHHDGQAATCTEAGWAAYDTCSRCSYTTRGEDIPPLNHDYAFDSFIWADDYTAQAKCICRNDDSHVILYTAVVTSKETTAPACESTGVRTYTATYDGHTDTKIETIAAKGHTYGNLIAEIPATCVAAGRAAYYECSVCHKLFDSEKRETTAEALVLPIDPNAHNWGEDGICTLCGAQKEGLAFVLKEDDTYEVSGIGTYKKTDLVIPATYRGKAVTSIGENAFKDCSDLTSLSFVEDSRLVSIGKWSFGDCIGLKSITLPTSLTTIESCAFYGCKEFESIAIPEGVTNIGGDAFTGCRKLISITLPKGVTIVESATFYGCYGLTSIDIPKDVTTIGNRAFAFCEDLRFVTLDRESKLSIIAFNAFHYCESLEEIFIPATVTSIGSKAFFNCKKLCAIYYGATAEQKQEIKIDADNEYLISATWYYYSETQPTEQGNFWHYVDGKIVIWDILHDYVPMVTEPTCTTGGYTTYTCSYCGDTYVADEKTALGHTYGSLIAESPATCVATGTAVHYKCSVCHTLFDANKVETTAEALVLPIDPDAHDLVHHAGQAATCTEAGWAAYDTCSRCSYTTRGADIPPLDHDYAFDSFVWAADYTAQAKYVCKNDATHVELYTATVAIATTDSSCERTGVRTYTATYDGHTDTKNETIAAKGHTYGDLISEIPATCVATGAAAHYECSVCHKLFDAEKSETTAEALVLPIDPNAHNWGANYVCTLCGERKASEGLEYRLKDDDTYEVSGIGTCTDTDLIIPDTYKDKAVTSIYWAFEGCSNIKSVYIPASVTILDGWAFGQCTGLTSVTFAEDSRLHTIGFTAFSGCSSLPTLTIPKSVTTIGDFAFAECPALVSITFPSGVKSIGDDVFRHSGDLASITVEEGNTVYHSAGNCLIKTATKTLIAGCKTSVIPSDGSVTVIGASAFYGSKLASITIPASVNRIDVRAFWDCTELASITVEEGNAVYHSAANCLIKTESKTLIVGSKNAVIPSDGSVEIIGDFAFYGQSSLRTIAIPASVTTLNISAFHGCSGLNSVDFAEDSHLTTIGSWAFCACSSLTSISIPSSVTSIEERAFWDTGLISITIPSSVTNIAVDTFCRSRQLKTVIFTEDSRLTSILGSTFENCTALTSVILSSNLKSISNYAFENCKALATVYYLGTEEDVAALTIEAKNASLISATWYYYSETQPKEGNKYWHYVDGVPTVWAACTHNYAAEVTSPTCTAGGYTTYTCSICGDSYVGDETAALGHDYASNVIVPPTCTAGGYTTYTCSRCGNCYVTNETEPLGHSVGAWSVTVAATCTAAGEKSGVCSACGATETRATAIDPDAHHWSEDVCTLCGEHTATEGLQYTYEEAIDAYVVSGYEGTDSVLYIPSRYQGKAVAQIGVEAFLGCTEVTSVVIGAGVTEIGEGAFDSCERLSSVTFMAGSKLGLIGEAAFYQCESLTEIVLPEGLEEIAPEAFCNCENLATVTLPSTLVTIGECAFDLTALTTVYYDGTGVANIGNYNEPLTNAEWLSIGA